MGVTYKAFDVDLRCPVTLKVINEKYLGDESARLRFLREARAAASVRHSNANCERLTSKSVTLEGLIDESMQGLCWHPGNPYRST